jgi:hypothetical protein
MAFSDTSIKFTVDDSTLLVGLTGIQKAVEGVGARMAAAASGANQNLEKHASLVDTLKTNWVAFSAAAVGAWMAVNKAMEIIELGAKAEQTAESFKMVADSSGIASDALLANLQRASAGTVADSDLMQSAVRGMVLGLNDQQLVKIMENARIAARYAGTDVQTAFEGISNAIGTDLPRALKQYGAITREETKLLEEGFTGAARQTELFAVAMANLDVNTAKFGVAAGNAAERVQKFHAIAKEAAEAGGSLLMWVPKIGLAGAEGFEALLTKMAASTVRAVGAEETYKTLMSVHDEMVKRGLGSLGLQMAAEKAADAASDVGTRAKLKQAQDVLAAEEAKLKAAARAKMTAEALAKYDEEEAKREDTLRKARFEAELQRQENVRKALEETFNARKVLGQTSLADDIAELNRRANLFPSGSPEQIKAKSDVAKATMEMTDQIFEHEKTMGMQSLQDEINFQKGKLAAAVANSPLRMKVEEDIYKKEQELRDKSLSAALGKIGKAADRLKAKGVENASAFDVQREVALMDQEEGKAAGGFAGWAKSGTRVMSLDDIRTGGAAFAADIQTKREGLGPFGRMLAQAVAPDSSRSGVGSAAAPFPAILGENTGIVKGWSEGMDKAFEVLDGGLAKIEARVNDSSSKIAKTIYGNVEEFFVRTLMGQVDRN